MKDYVYKKRLLKLADLLDKLPEKRFNFRRWVSMDWDGTPLVSCGTQACAFGWATTIPSLYRAGLRLGKSVQDSFGTVYLARDGTPNSATDALNCAEHAAKEIFDLSSDEFDFLFFPIEETGAQMHGRNAPHSDASAKDLAKHIRFFVNAKYPN